MSFPLYNSYRDSGLDWLGEVPSHWSIAPIKRAFDVIGGSTPKSEVPAFWDGDVPWITPADLSRVEGLEIGSSLRMITEDGVASCGTTKVPPGTVILSTRAPIGSLAITTVAACTNQGCKALVPKGGLDSRLLARMLSVATRQLNIRGRGTTFLELSADELGGFKIPIPPAAEQAAIAAFLDRETTKIDALVAEQRRLIELLKEKRQALISHAVTKGLDPSAPMKDSGAEWLGDVPAHWAVKRVKHAARMESGHTPDKKIAAYWTDCDIPWVSLHDTGYLRDNEYISETAQYVNQLGIANSSARLLPFPAVVFSRDATIGRCAITTRPMAVSQHFIAWICREELMPEYLLYCFRSMGHELERMTAGATLKTIGMPDVRKLTIAVPPMDEQAAIVQHIREVIGRMDALTSSAETATVLLSERRSALISAAVTGKIDVRDAAKVSEKAEAA